MGKVLEKLGKDYTNHEFEFAMPKNTEEEKIFHEKYINPALEQDFDTEIEEDFYAAVAEAEKAGFKNGFRVCMALITECGTLTAEHLKAVEI